MKYAIRYKGGICYHVFNGINAMKPWDEHLRGPEGVTEVEDMFIIWADEEKRYPMHQWGS